MAEESRPAIRVGDAEREATAAQLRQHATEGRLTLDELDERLRDAYAARTVPELNRLLEDLPALRLDDIPRATPTTASAQVAAGRGGGPERRMWAAWASASAVNVVIWAVVCLGTWHAVYPWWIWVAGPWGAVLVGSEIQNRARRRGLDTRGRRELGG